MRLIHIFILYVFAFAMTSNTTTAIAQKKEKPSLEIILSDHSPLQISINGRLYKKINNKLIIKDLPARNNNIEVIKKCNRSENSNCKDEIVFSGKVKMERNKNYQAVVLVNEGKMMVSDEGDLFSKQSLEPIQTTGSNETSNSEFQKIADIKASLSPDLTALGERMKKINKDTDRVNAATNYVKNRSQAITTDEAIAISSWIMYDESKLQFLKNAYPKISDPTKYHEAHIVFTMVSYRDQFTSFVSEQQ